MSKIYPMMIKIDKTIKEEIYYVALPKTIKEKWIELEKASKFISLTNFNLNIYTLRNMLNTHLDGIVDVNKVSTNSDDSKWIKSFKEPNMKKILGCFRVWIEEFYINGELANDNKRKNGSDLNVKRLAEELIDLMKEENFENAVKEELVLFEKGKAVNNEAYTLYPLRIINSFMGKEINIKGKKSRLLYSRRNELITDTRDFSYKENYMSFVIKLSVQTIPPYNEAYLNVDLSIRRWAKNISNKENNNMYLPTDKNCYIRVKNDRMQELKGGYNSKLKKLSWDEVDYNCFKQCNLSNTIPEFNEVLKNLNEFNKGEINDILVPFKDDIKWITTKYHAGVFFADREIVFKYIKEHLKNVDNLESKIEAESIRASVGNPVKFCEKFEIDSSLFLNQLNKALDGEKVTIEIYIDSDLIKSLKKEEEDETISIEDIKKDVRDYLNKYFDNDNKYKIIISSEVKILKVLEKTKESKKSNLAGFEKRVEEIEHTLNKVSTPTLAFVFIRNKDYYDWLDKKISIDPKHAIRCGFASTGRLTQFITFENYKSEWEKVQERTADDYDGKEQPSNKINLVLHNGILDGFRQLGVTYDYSGISKLKGNDVIGIHICNYKKTIYNCKIPQFPIIIRYDINNSKIYAYCDLVDKVEVPYWKLNLGLASIGARRDIAEFIKENMSSTSLYRRLDRIINKSEKEKIIFIESNGTSRNFVKGISNSEIEKAKSNIKSGNYELLINDDKKIDLNDSQKISFIRIRHNEEVASYVPDKSKNGNYTQTSGAFKYERVYYAIEGKPPHEAKVYNIDKSKVDSTAALSHRNMIELYPIFISNSDENKEKDVVAVTRKMKQNAIQFDLNQETVLPLPLHLAERAEEYLYTIK